MENYFWVVPCVLGLLALNELARITRSLQNMEEMIKRLVLPEPGGGVPAEPSSRVRELASSRRHYVAAIKTYREQTGLGLREAKVVVDALASRNRVD